MDTTTENRPGSIRLAASAFAALAAALLLLLPGPARGAAAAIDWTPATKADRTEFVVVPGRTIVLTLTARASKPLEGLAIHPVGGLPAGSTVDLDTTGGATRAVFRWKTTDEGEFTLRFVAKAGAGAVSPIRTYVVRVHAKGKALRYPVTYGLANAKLAHFATVERTVAARAKPRASARTVATLSMLTPEHTLNVVLVLGAIEKSASETWYRVRLPILPNNSTGWVPARALGELTQVDTHLYIDRTKLTATLKRKGATVFTARIGVGEPQWPTPRGQFYVRSRLTNFGSPVYGALAFGTSARSPVLTDWPGGGFVGIHGTNQPEILPGAVSHGCIRMRNEDILALSRLMKVGTPVTVR